MGPIEPRLQISSLDAGAIAVMGEIDASTCDDFASALANDGGAPVQRVEMSGVTFIDSSGLRVLIAHHQGLADSGTTLQVVEPSRAVQRLLEITGLGEPLDIVG